MTRKRLRETGNAHGIPDLWMSTFLALLQEYLVKLAGKPVSLGLAQAVMVGWLSS